MLRAENAEVLIHPSDRKYGALLVGGRGTGKTSALLSFYLNDIEDPDAAPIVINPKSELSRICLRMTPPACSKRVWFVDLGHPAFGVSPLRLIGDRPLAIEAAQIAENVVAALLDINENQIYQSSRRYLYHAVIGAIAIANKQSRRPRLEDVYTLLRPAKEDFRNAIAEACADQPDLDQTAESLRATRRPPHGHQPRRRTTGRAAQQDLGAQTGPADRHEGQRVDVGSAGGEGAEQLGPGCRAGVGDAHPEVLGVDLTCGAARRRLDVGAGDFGLGGSQLSTQPPVGDPPDAIQRLGSAPA
jgi:hypothetical protein